jgi:four helix bundle protein
LVFWVRFGPLQGSVRGSSFAVRRSPFAVRGSYLEPTPPTPARLAEFASSSDPPSTFLGNAAGIPAAAQVAMGSGVRRFTDLRAWQTCDAYKKAIYRLIKASPALQRWSRRGQLEDSVAGPPAHISEGYGRFSPPDFARYCVMARSSLMESQNHLIDAVDKELITEEIRRAHDRLAETALEEVTGLMEYLQSPEALKNARLARERRIASRGRRTRNLERGTKTRTAGTEPRTPGTEPRSGEPNSEPRTEPGSSNHEPN